MSMVSVSEMARQCGLSRARFYQLMGTTFPRPVYDVATRRPFTPRNFNRCVSKFAVETVASTGNQ